jgi:uncharacterized membrane protein
MSLCSLTDKLDVQAPVDKVFLHYTDTDQMVRFFPSSLKLHITRRTSKHITQGSSMEYEARLLGMSMKWRSYIHSFSPKRHITYMWRCTSWMSIEQDFYFETVNANQTRVIQCFLYRPPLGKFGLVLNSIFLKPYLKKILDHQRTVLSNNFTLASNKPS